MDKNAWDERRRGLEDEFFARQNRELVGKLRAKQNHEETVLELERATGITDPHVLRGFADLGVTPSAVLALSLVPLITVAWADHKMDGSERDAILKAADEHGIGRGAAAHDMLLAWLSHKPEASLFDAWALYVKGLKDALDPPAFATLESQILGRANAVAAAAGGFLGLGSKVSDVERKEIDRVAQAFRG